MNRATLLSAVFAFAAPVAFVMGWNWVFDPYQYYRPWRGEIPIFSTNARWQNPGLIKHYDYDTVIVGTSRSQNFTPSLFEPADWNVLKVTAEGSDADEQLSTIDLVLSIGRARRVILELSPDAYLEARASQTDVFPEFLYHPSPETPFQYLLSLDLLRESYLVSRGAVPPRSLETLDVWWNAYKHEFDPAIARDRIRGDCARHGRVLPWSVVRERIDRLATVVRSARDVEFVAFLPPVSAYGFAFATQERLRTEFMFREAIAELDRQLEPLTVYDYASQADIVLDLGRYKDRGHFDVEVTRRIARELAAGTGPILDNSQPVSALIGILARVDRADLGCT